MGGNDQFQRLVVRRGHDGGEIVQQAGQTEGCGLERQPAGLDLGEVQDVVDEDQQRAAGVANLEDQVARRRVERLPFQQIAEAQHRVHRRADLVAHIGQELGFHARRLFGQDACLQHFGLGRFACGDIDIGDEHPIVRMGVGHRADREPPDAIRPDDAHFHVAHHPVLHRAHAGKLVRRHRGAIRTDERPFLAVIGPAEVFLPRDPQQDLRGPIAVDDPTGPVRDRDPDRQQVVHGAQLGLGGLQLRGPGRDQLREACLLVLQGALRLPDLGHVMDAHHDAEHAPIVSPEGSVIRLHIAEVAIGIGSMEAEQLGPADQRGLQAGADLRIERRAHDLAYQSALQLSWGGSAHVGIGGIDQPEAPVPIDEGQHLVGGLDDLLVTTQFQFRLFALGDVDDDADIALQFPAVSGHGPSP